MNTLYNDIKIRKTENGWILSYIDYYNDDESGDRAFTREEVFQHNEDGFGDFPSEQETFRTLLYRVIELAGPDHDKYGKENVTVTIGPGHKHEDFEDNEDDEEDDDEIESSKEGSYTTVDAGGGETGKVDF